MKKYNTIELTKFHFCYRIISKFIRILFHHSYLIEKIYRQKRLVAYINTFARLDNMLHVVDLQNIFNPFNGTLIERKQDTWSFLKTKNVFLFTKKLFSSFTLHISCRVFISCTKPFLFMKVAIISFLCYAYWTDTFSSPSFSYWEWTF